MSRNRSCTRQSPVKPAARHFSVKCAVGVREPSKYGREVNWDACFSGNASTTEQPRTCTRQLSPTATACQEWFGCSTKPSKVLKAPRSALSCAYHGRSWAAICLCQTSCRGGSHFSQAAGQSRGSFTQPRARRLAHTSAKELSVAPSATAKRPLSAFISQASSISPASLPCLTTEYA